MSAADRALPRLTIAVARCRRRANYMSGHMSWLQRRRVPHRAPTNEPDKTNFTVPSQVSLGASSATPLPLRLLCWIPDKLALSRSLTAPLTAVPLVGADSSLVFQQSEVERRR
jgi:hypothetical protein